ncbi:hypothetical protein VTJ49DRAFT_3081 [Mycothermus thermophilus]|uniref:RCC1-like domain-containing protein n=1 Tax=Humicola insolens TaxID=85995 RepID=A0ABR3V8D9_HUMIN
MLVLQALGSNGSGQLGLGHTDDVSTPQPVLLPSDLFTTTNSNSTEPSDQHPQPKLLSISAGGNHTLLLFSSGILLWSGDPTTGACGRVEPTPPTSADTPGSSPPAPRFRPVDLTPLPEDVRRNVSLVTATWEASIIATSSLPTDKVYSFGSGAKGELGLGPGTLRAGEPTLIPNFPALGTKVVHLAACMGHVVAVLSNGEAWGWGNGRKGQLGEPAVGVVYSPRRIEGVDFKVAKAVCGREFTCLFGPPESGEVLVLGSDKWGVKSQAPKMVKGWKEVGAGWGSVYVLKEDGTLLSWGRNDHGQMAPEDLGRVRAIAVGSEHAMALTDAGDLMAWGWGEHGNCGPICGPICANDGPKGQQNKIASIGPEIKIAMIGAGCATSWIALEKAPST